MLKPVLILASEASGASHTVEMMVVVATVALTLVTLALTWVTWLVHKDSTKELSHANDNATSVAMAEIDAHHAARIHNQRLRELRRIQHTRKH